MLWSFGALSAGGAAVVIVPVVMNKRYMEAGLDGNTTGQTTVPVMEQAATRETDEPVSIP